MSAPRNIISWHNKAAADAYRAAGIWGDRTLAEVFDEQVAFRPDKLAIADQHVRWSYADLQDLTLRLGSVLVGLGVGPGEPVAAQLPSSAWLVAMHLAINRVGGIFVPLSTTWRTSEVGSLLRAVQPPVFVVPGVQGEIDFLELAQSLQAEVTEMRHILTLDGEGPNALPTLLAETEQMSTSDLERHRPDPDGPAHVMCSSGTTGMPKASVWGGNDLLTLLGGHFRNAIKLSEDDVAAGLAPANTGSTGYAFPGLAAVLVGASAVMLERWSPQAALDLIVAERCTYATAIPTQMVMMLELALEDADLTRFTRFNNAGAPLAPATAEAIENRMGCRVQTIYGATDGGVPVMSRVDASDAARRTSVGTVCEGEELQLVDPEGRVVPSGEVGEVRWRGANKSFGYLNQPDYDAQAWDEDGWFNSGDLGQFDEEGSLHIVGRTKDMILRGGTNIFPREIEELLIRHPDVTRVAVVGVPDARLGEQACAVVVPLPGRQPALADLTSYLLEQGVAKFKLPEHLVLVEDLVTNAGGKIDKASIRALALERLARP